MRKQTKAIHTPFPKADAYGAIAMPVYHTAAYRFDTATEMVEAFNGRSGAPDYSRVMNPTVMCLEDKVKALTGAADAVAFSSGMAAIANTIMALASAGSNIVTSTHMFGNTYALVNKTLSRFGVDTRLVDLTDLKAVKEAVDGHTCCIYLEIITNPQMEVADLRALAAIAHSNGVPLVADTTAIPFTEFSAKELGVDVEVVSATKYISGGGTSIGGLAIDYGTVEGFASRIRNEMLLNLGSYMTPHVAYMMTLGLETLNVRYAAQAANALALAHKLQCLPQIVAVNYPGLKTNRYHNLARSQFGPTSGAMLTIELESKEACFKMIDSLKLICRATNLFDNKSLAIHPASTIFGPFTDQERRRMDISDNIVRLSVGLEDTEDLFDDIKQALR